MPCERSLTDYIGEAQYIRTRNSASTESVKRAKELLTSGVLSQPHALFGEHDTMREREEMLAKISGFRPSETVFEIGKRGNSDEAVEVMRKRRRQIDSRKQKGTDKLDSGSADTAQKTPLQDDSDEDVGAEDAHNLEHLDSGSESDELEVSIAQPAHGSGPDDWQSSEFFMKYTPSTNVAEEKSYGVHSGSYNTAREHSNFVEAARGAEMTLANDELKGM